MNRSVFQIAGVTSVLAFVVALLPFYASSTGRPLRLLGLLISAGAFGPGLFAVLAALWLLAVVCLILSLARRERLRALSIVLLTSLIALPVIAVAALGMH